MAKNNSDEKNEEVTEIKRESHADYHKIPIEELFKRFETHPDTGLTSSAAEAALIRYGKNVLTPPKKTPEWLKFLKAVFTGFSSLLVIGSLLCFGAFLIQYFTGEDPPMDNLYLGIVLAVVVLITGIFSYYQESKSSRIMESFKKLVPQECLVIRDGKKIAIKAENIVPGDVIEIKGGDLVPADFVVIEASGLKVDNSSLTGESEPQKRGNTFTHENVLETANVVFAFTFAVEGSGRGVVVNTGDNTMMGGIAKLTAGVKTGKTPIGIEIQKFIHLITGIAVVLGIVSFLVAYFILAFTFLDAVIFLIGIIVANVPEGLLATVTLALTLTAKRMAKKNCLVKNLESVETLGSTSVICSDKTGTLTQNRMSVSHIWTSGSIATIETAENISRTHFEGGTMADDMLFKICALCNRAEFRDDQDFDLPIARWITSGDASETALIKYVERSYHPVSDVRKKYLKVFEIPFNSTNKYQVSIHEQPDDSRYLLVMKGAPERIIERCSHILIKNEVLELTQDWIKSFNDAYMEMGGMGERVLGFCYFYLPESSFARGCEFQVDDKLLFSLQDLIFAGLTSLIDPPRAAVPDAVRLCCDAGIRVVMVTGDHPITAVAIAKNVGIISDRCETYPEFLSRKKETEKQNNDKIGIVVTGSDLKDMSHDDTDAVIDSHWEIVFARTSPQQKLLIVEAFQRAGFIVAVTGDGVNDSPALRKADIGVAMGIAGSDVAKQAADMILLDDNFSTIVTGVEEGRIIFDNLKKSIAYTLTSNIPEILPFLVSCLFAVPPPLGTITILCIDLGTDMYPAISLACEKPESDIMKRPPRNSRTDRLVNWRLIRYSYALVGMYQALVGMLVYLYIMMANGFTWSYLTVAKDWIDSSVPFIVDSYGQEWPYSARRDLEYTCYTAYFMAIVIVQWADITMTQNRLMSILSRNIFSNLYLVSALFFEFILMLLISYIPFINIGLFTRPVPPEIILFSFPFGLFMIVVDELRRLYIRRNPKSFLHSETFY